MGYKMNKITENPILKASMCPYPAELVFNAGVVYHDGIYYMIFRNDREWIWHCDFKHMDLGLATSRDGIHFEVYDKPVFPIEELGDPEIGRLYDVRLTELEGKIYATMAVETKHGLRAGIGVTEDCKHLKLISQSLPDNRNLVLFPEKINGQYVRLERPFTTYNDSNYDMWISRSNDMIYWGESELCVRHEDIELGGAKIGPGTPPIKTEKGWLSLMHAVDYDENRGKNGYEPLWKRRYCAYALLLDLENPAKVIGISPEPVIMPEESYEVSGGFRNNVVFPMALLKTGEDTVRAYYGAADTVMAAAEGSIAELINSCTVKVNK